MRNSILKRTFRYFLISLCVMIAVFMVFVMSYLNRQYKEQFVSSQLYVTQKTAETVDLMLMEVKQSAYFLCCNDALAEALINDEGVGQSNQRRQISDAFIMNIGTPVTNMLQSAYEIFFVDPQFGVSTENALFNLETADGSGRKRVYNACDVQDDAWYKQTVGYDAQIFAFTSPEAPDRLMLAHYLRNIHLTDPRYSDSAGVVLYMMPMKSVTSLLQNDQMSKDSISLLLFNDQILASTSEMGGFVKENEETALLIRNLPEDGKVTDITYGGISYVLSAQTVNSRWKVAVLTPSANMRQAMINMLPMLGTFMLVLIIVSLLISVMFSRRLSAPIQNLSEAMVRAREAQELPQPIPVAKSGDEIEYLYHSYNDIVENIHRISELEREQNAKLQKSELKALQSQINPHFVYNTLDSVACIALLNGEDDIATMVASLINILKYSIRFSSMRVRLREEIDYLQQYIQIQSLRYRERFRFICDVPEEYGDVKVPKLLIQPLVENALFYAENEQLLEIRVYCEEVDGQFRIHVCDNGSNADAAQLNERLQTNPTGEKYGIGIVNVNKRIQLMAGDAYGLHYEQLPEGGLDAIITLPFEKIDKNNG